MRTREYKIEKYLRAYQWLCAFIVTLFSVFKQLSIIEHKTLR